MTEAAAGSHKGRKIAERLESGQCDLVVLASYEHDLVEVVDRNGACVG